MSSRRKAVRTMRLPLARSCRRRSASTVSSVRSLRCAECSARAQLAIVMELVEGQTLRELLPVPIPRLVEIATQVLEGLEYAHGQGIVHRDIKPENIIVTKESTAKLMDFGLARSEGRSRLTVTGMVVGTVAYLAPEQALGGQVDGRSDLY